MRLVGRLFLIPFALLLAISASTLFLALAAILDPGVGIFAAKVIWTGLWTLAQSLDALDEAGTLPGDAFAGFQNVAASLILAPPTFVALVGEVAGWRAFLWYSCATGAITAALPWLARAASRPATGEELHITAALFLAGAAAGAVYWLLAGQSAGRAGRVPTASSSGRA